MRHGRGVAMHGNALTTRSRAGLGAALLVALGAFGAGTAPAAQHAATLRLDAPAHVKAGEPFGVTLRVSGAARLAGYETQVLFDRQQVGFGGVWQRESGLRRGGRDVEALGHIDLA